MNAREAIRNSIASSDFIVNAYLGDLTDAELLVRPVPGANHIAWQLGHLISSMKVLVEAAFPGSMPALPTGFTEKHSKETASSDNPGAFLTKAQYEKLYAEQRQGVIAKLMSLTDADLDEPAPEQFRSFMQTIGDLFSLQAGHVTMHAGQWAVTRRKLGRKPLF